MQMVMAISHYDGGDGGDAAIDHDGPIVINAACVQVRGFGLASPDLRQFTKGQVPRTYGRVSDPTGWDCGAFGCLVNARITILKANTTIEGVS